MRSILFLLTIVGFLFPNHLSAQDADTEYAIVEYMRVKPGMAADYRECEAVWKLIHAARKEAGYINGWQLEEILYPSGTDTEYQFITITQVKSWQAIGDLSDTWNEETWKELTRGLTPEQLELADKAEDYRDLVKREIWSPMDMALAPGGNRPKFAVENYMKIPATGWDAWMEMESDFFKPVHEKSIALGLRAGWLMTALVLPRGEDYPYQASTVDLYDTWEDMNKDNEAAWQAIYPKGVSFEMVEQRANAARTIAKTEVRMLVDYVD
jgi:hypothetical protein